jgi:L-lactate dehydrogenase complex protein LldF
VKIDIHAQLWKWRQVLAAEKYLPGGKRRAMAAMALVLSSPRLYRLAGNLGRLVMRFLPLLVKNKWWNPWYRQRELPAPPAQSFSNWWKKNRNERKR